MNTYKNYSCPPDKCGKALKWLLFGGIVSLSLVFKNDKWVVYPFILIIGIVDAICYPHGRLYKDKVIQISTNDHTVQLLDKGKVLFTIKSEELHIMKYREGLTQMIVFSRVPVEAKSEINQAVFINNAFRFPYVKQMSLDFPDLFAK